jgi:hypothetical protein
MNFTTGRTFPSRSTWTRLQYASLATGLALALALGTALAVGWPANATTGGPSSLAVAPPVPFQPAAGHTDTTIYIVGTQAEAHALTSAANEGIGGPTRVIVAAWPEEELVSLMMTEQAHSVLQGTNIIDLRDR